MISKDQLQEGIELLGIQTHKNTVDQLLSFSNLVIKWNKTHNLTSITEPEEFVVKHLLDSFSLLPYIEIKKNNHRNETTDKKPVRLLDIGSGAGFPGLVLAIANNQFSLFSIDSNQKRIAFQNHIIRELDLKHVETAHVRVEDLREKFSMITSRAFASISQTIEKSEHLIEKDG